MSQHAAPERRSADTPPYPYRAVSERTSISVKPATAASVIVFVVTMTVGSTLWAANIAHGQDDLMRWARLINSRLQRLEAAVGVKGPPAPDPDARLDPQPFTP